MTLGKGLILFAVIRLLISLANWIFYIVTTKTSFNSRGDNTLSDTAVESLSVLIPARNEENNLKGLLAGILSFPVQPLEIIVYDDLSTDRTADVVRDFMAGNPHLKLVTGRELPQGWLGKNYACYLLAREAQGNNLLFLDADVHVKNGLFQKSLSYMQKYKIKLLSIFPVQDMPTIGSRLSVPVMNWILLSLLALPLVRLSRLKAFSAANGQFMLFDTPTYTKLQPHFKCKDNPVEDIAIIRKYKKERIRVATLSGMDDIHCTMYHTLKEAVEGFSKNIFQFFGGSIVLTYLFALITTISPLYLFLRNGFFYGILYIIVVVTIRIFVSLSGKQSVASNILLMIPQQFIFWRIILSATWKLKNKNVIWKDRNISS